MGKEIEEYQKMSSGCPENGQHKLVFTKWPFLICEHCKQEYVLFTKEMVDQFFDINIFTKTYDA